MTSLIIKKFVADLSLKIPVFKGKASTSSRQSGNFYKLRLWVWARPSKLELGLFHHKLKLNFYNLFLLLYDYVWPIHLARVKIVALW